jgi:hypothetical protein
MSWKFPEHPIKSGGVVEIDDINRNIGEFAQELDGGLNEHNWKKDSFNRFDCSDDVSMECWRTTQIQDPTVNAFKFFDEYHRAHTHQGWFTVKSPSQTCSITAKTSSCKLWVMASLQHYQVEGADGSCQYALRIDGVVIPETMTGASSTLDDAYHEGSGAVYTTTNHGSGVSQVRRSVSLDTIVSVAPGTHTIELVQRTVSVDGIDTYFYVGSRELLVIAMRN